MVLKLAVYGKGGIGKSTVCSNLSTAFGLMGYSVLQVGCDPKHDSTYTLCGKFIPTIIDVLNEKGFEHEEISAKDIVFEGKNGVHAVETGGPVPGSGCGGFAIGEGIKLLKELDSYENYDVIIFDVLGDIVCGGFSVPMSESDYVFIVTSDDLDSLFAANRINSAVYNTRQKNEVKLGGVIANRFEDTTKIEEFVSGINTDIIAKIPRDENIRDSKFKAKTMFEISDGSSEGFREMAENILAYAKQSPKENTKIDDYSFFYNYVN